MKPRYEECLPDNVPDPWLDHPSEDVRFFAAKAMEHERSARAYWDAADRELKSYKLKLERQE